MDWKTFFKTLLTASCFFFSVSSFASLILFVEPDDGYKPVLKELNAAKHSIDMEVYLLTDRKIIATLIAAKKRGVDVRVILEKDLYGNGNQASTRRTLENAGIKVKWSDPAFFNLTHEKAFDVDQKRLVIMTLNQTYSAYHYNREYGAIDVNPSDNMEFTKVFEGDWERLYPEVNVQDLVWSPNNTSCKLIQRIKSATHTLFIESEELNDKAVENLLIQKAQTGVDVRLILPPQQKDNAIDHVVKGGVHVRILSRKPLYLHAKLIIADNNTGFIGSQNLSSYAFQMNRELGTMIYASDHLRRFLQAFEADWKKAVPIKKQLS